MVHIRFRIFVHLQQLCCCWWFFKSSCKFAMSFWCLVFLPSQGSPDLVLLPMCSFRSPDSCLQEPNLLLAISFRVILDQPDIVSLFIISLRRVIVSHYWFKGREYWLVGSHWVCSCWSKRKGISYELKIQLKPIHCPSFSFIGAEWYCFSS